MNTREFFPAQSHLLLDKARHTHVLAAGVGYGKTTFGVDWLLTRILANGRVNAKNKAPHYVCFQPIRSLVKTVNLPEFTTRLEAMGLREGRCWRLQKTELILEFTQPHLDGASVFFAGANNYKTVLAHTFAAGWVDEPGWMTDEQLQEIYKRIRMGGTVWPVQKLLTGVPQGVGVSMYFRLCTGSEFDTHGSYEADGKTWVRWRHKPGTLVLQASTHENPYLSPDYTQTLQDTLGHKRQLYEQQVHGIFVSASGNTLFDLADENLVDVQPEERPGGVRWFSWDFNVGQVTVLAFEERNGEWFCVWENGSRARDTREACAQIREAFGRRYRSEVWRILGDSSGNNRDTRSGLTDFRIIQQELAGYNVDLGAVNSRKSNPDLRLSIHATNKLLSRNELTDESPKLYIAKRCKELINSLRMTEPDTSGKIKKPSGETWTHPSDALRYFVWEVSPISARVFGGLSRA